MDEARNRRRKEEKRERKREKNKFLLSTIDSHRLSLLHKFGLTAEQDNEYAIRSAYRRMVLKYHPDKNSSPDAARIFNDLTYVYESLIIKA